MCGVCIHYTKQRNFNTHAIKNVNSMERAHTHPKMNIQTINGFADCVNIAHFPQCFFKSEFVCMKMCIQQRF